MLFATAFATDSTPPEGTKTSFGVYGIVDDIGLASGPQTRAGVFNSTVSLAAGKSFTSYQYEISSSYSTVAAGLLPKTSGTKFKIYLYGSNSVGGKKTLVGSKEMSYVGTDLSDMEEVSVSRKYQYYNIVVTNTGTKTGKCYIEIDKQ